MSLRWGLTPARSRYVAAALATLLGACEWPHERLMADTAAGVVDTLVRLDTTPALDAVPRPRGAGTTGSVASRPASPSAEDLAYLRSRALLIPVANVRAADLPDTFNEARGGGTRRHEAIDILAPRGTPVLSADGGRILRLHTSAAGGLSVYAADPSGRFVYFYAHLDRYAPWVRDGMPLRRGDTIGFVGTTGNAPPNTPHLHFAVTRLHEPGRWWGGTPINPYPLLTGRTP